MTLSQLRKRPVFGQDNRRRQSLRQKCTVHGSTERRGLPAAAFYFTVTVAVAEDDAPAASVTTRSNG